MDMQFTKKSFGKRLKSMLRLDLKRTFVSPLFYIMVGICLVVPILILVMTTMMDGSVSTNPQTGEQTVMEGFKNVWQIIGSLSPSPDADPAAGMSMDLVSMCNIHLVLFAVPVFVCLFVCEDFRSGYAKNLFTVRAKKTDYIISKTVVGFLAGAVMLVAFFLGSMIGGAVASLPFDMEGFTPFNVFCSMLCKIFLSLLFVSIAVTMSSVGKQKTWLAMLLSLGAGMLLFTMTPMISPLDAGFVNVLLCLVGGCGFAVGMGAISNAVLQKTALV